MTRSTVPGYLASAAALALAAAAPVTAVPKPGGVPCAEDEGGAPVVAAAFVDVAVVFEDAPQPARTPATASAAAAPGLVLAGPREKGMVGNEIMPLVVRPLRIRWGESGRS